MQDISIKLSDRHAALTLKTDEAANWCEEHIPLKIDVDINGSSVKIDDPSLNITRGSEVKFDLAISRFEEVRVAMGRNLAIVSDSLPKFHR